ncbi:MAG TPA: hypothetical protein PLK20_06030 [Paludibacteraceae bacterium]|nr:hypothetical protein [Paludibacteraceae bacterium]
MKKLFFLLAAFCCAAALHAQTEITTVEFSFNRDAIDFYIGNTEGAVANKITENTSTPAEVGYYCSNMYLLYENSPGNFWGIGLGEGAISGTKTYAVELQFCVKTDYAWPADLNTLIFIWDGDTIVPGLVENVTPTVISAYLLLGAPAEAPAPTYTLTLVNVDKHGYPNWTYTGGDYFEGTSITFQYKAPEDGKVFDKWVSEGLTLTTEQEIDNPLTIVMPANAVTITATYKNATAINNVKLEAPKSKKIIVDGVVYILRDEKVYNLQGKECELPKK